METQGLLISCFLALERVATVNQQQVKMYECGEDGGKYSLSWGDDRIVILRLE
jgi:hypothetical protein